MLAAYGSTPTGDALYTLGGCLVHAYNYSGSYAIVRSVRPVSTWRSCRGLRLQKTETLQEVGTLTIAGDAVGTCKLPRTRSRISVEPLRIGRGGLAPVSSDYAGRGAFPFPGSLRRVAYELGDDRQGRAQTPHND